MHSCIEGPYDSVCGDREKTRGTYRRATPISMQDFSSGLSLMREFVLFDSEDVYVEYAAASARACISKRCLMV